MGHVGAIASNCNNCLDRYKIQCYQGSTDRHSEAVIKKSGFWNSTGLLYLSLSLPRLLDCFTDEALKPVRKFGFFELLDLEPNISLPPAFYRYKKPEQQGEALEFLDVLPMLRRMPSMEILEMDELWQDSSGYSLFIEGMKLVWRRRLGYLDQSLPALRSIRMYPVDKQASSYMLPVEITLPITDNIFGNPKSNDRATKSWPRRNFIEDGMTTACIYNIGDPKISYLVVD